MTEKSILWTTGSTGDGASPYTQAEWIRVFRQMFLYDNTVECVLKNYANELEVTGTASPVAVNTGGAVVYGFPYWNTASVNVTIPTPTTNTRIDRIVLKADWTAQTVRITRLAGTEGAGVPPTLTQSDGSVWEVSLAQVSITTGGVITVTDERDFISPNLEVITAMLADLAVTTAKINDLAVTEGKIATGAVTEGKIGAGAVTNAKLGADAITTDKIQAGAVQENDIAAGAVTNAKLGADAVTSDKIQTGAVQESDIGTGAVTTNKIGDSQVTAAKIGPGEVVTNNLDTGAVTADKLAASAVQTAKIASGAVAEDKIGAGAVTKSKIGAQTMNVGHPQDPITNAHLWGQGNSLSGIIHWSYNGVDGTARNIIPNGSGDVVHGVRFMHVTKLTAGGSSDVSSNTFFLIPGSTQDVTIGSVTFQFRVQADGTFDVRRTAGADTGKIAVWALWM